MGLFFSFLNTMVIYWYHLWVIYYIRDNIWNILTIEGTKYHGIWIIHADSHCMIYIYICLHIHVSMGYTKDISKLRDWDDRIIME